MRKRLKIITGSGVGFIFLFITLIFVTPLFQILVLFTPYYKTCAKVQMGMRVEEAFAIMKPYQDLFYGEDPRGIHAPYEKVYIYSSTNGNNCRIFVKDGKVFDRELDFN